MSNINRKEIRESGCPVHFIWDGHGVGRPFVRAGFLGFVATGAVYSLSLTGLISKDWSQGVFAVAAGLWVIGQILVAVGKKRRG